MTIRLEQSLLSFGMIQEGFECFETLFTRYERASQLSEQFGHLVVRPNGMCHRSRIMYRDPLKMLTWVFSVKRRNINSQEQVSGNLKHEYQEHEPPQAAR